MTLDDRVAALAPFGVTPRQARFLVIVALHSGYCLRRQYEAFAGLQYGKNVRDFLDGLVARQLAERFTGRADRGHIYHVHARRLYRALGQEDNRNRRSASAAQIARKVMGLDYVLRRPDVTWYATEDEKVDLFVTRFGVTRDQLPRRVFDSSAGAPRTTRYFLHKLPIGVVGEPPVVHFVYPVTDARGDGLAAFLRDHARLFRAVPAWAVVAIGAKTGPGFRMCRAVFERHALNAPPPPTVADLRWYFERRQTIDRGEIARIGVRDLARFRELRDRLNDPVHERRYAAWLATGAIAPASESETAPRPPIHGQLLIEPLPFTYEQFGSLPGVA